MFGCDQICILCGDEDSWTCGQLAFWATDLSVARAKVIVIISQHTVTDWTGRLGSYCGDLPKKIY